MLVTVRRVQSFGKDLEFSSQYYIVLLIKLLLIKNACTDEIIKLKVRRIKYKYGARSLKKMWDLTGLRIM